MFEITNSEHGLDNVELNLSKVELNNGGSEHDFDEFELDIDNIGNYFYDFGHNLYDSNVYNQIINF